MRHSGFIYRGATDTAATIQDLTASQLDAFKLVGLPIRVEHSGGDLEVGRVTFQHPVDAAGDARVDFDLHEMAEGWAADEAIKRGGLSELSLKHFVDTQTGAVWPTEVSLVIKGLRDGTTIVDRDYKGVETQPRRIVEMEASAAAAQPAHEAPAGAPASGDARSPASAGEKRAAEDAPLGASAAKRTNTEVLKDILGEIHNNETQDRVIGFIETIMKDQLQSKTEHSKLRTEYDELMKKHNSHTNNIEAMARQNGSMLAHIISKLAGGNGVVTMTKDETSDLASKLGTVMAQDSKLFNALNRHVPIAASRLDNIMNENADTEINKRAALAKISEYENAIKDLGVYDTKRNGSPFETRAVPSAPAAPRKDDIFAAPPPVNAVGAPTAFAGVSAPQQIEIAASKIQRQMHALVNEAKIPSWLEEDINRIDASARR